MTLDSALAPTAWDNLFSDRPDGWVRIRLKSGAWVGGALRAGVSGRESYAGGHPEPADLFVAYAVEVDPETGEWVADADGEPRSRDAGILVQWQDVELLELVEPASEARDG